MTIGLICAIPHELEHLRAALDWAETVELAHVRFDRGRLDGHEVVLVGAGIGKVNTTLVATLLADRFACRLIVFSGVAGGLDPSLHIGDVVIADRTMQHDAGVIEDERLADLPGRARALLQSDGSSGLPGGCRTCWSGSGHGWRVSLCRRCPGLLVARAAARGSCSGRSCPATSTSIASARASGCFAISVGQPSRWRAARSGRSPRRSRSLIWTSARCRTWPAAIPASTSPRSSQRLPEVPPVFCATFCPFFERSFWSRWLTSIETSRARMMAG